MRKKIWITVIIFHLFYVFPIVSYAEENLYKTDILEEAETKSSLRQKETESSLSQKELEYLSMVMEDHKIGGEITGEILYNRHDNPNFLMGTSEKGYLILYRNTLEFLECGEGQNPYSDVDDSTMKYYGGFLCYCISSEEGYFDLVKDETVVEIPYLLSLEEMERAVETSLLSKKEIDNADVSLEWSARAVRTPPVILPKADDYIRRLAFGYNNDNSCTAVALGIVLNYLDRTVNGYFVSNDMESERLKTTELIDLNKKKLYSKADRLHRYLVDTCNMVGPCYADAVIRGLHDYRKKSQEILNTEISVNWTMTGITKYIENEIDLYKPSMITTTLGNGELNLHTMVVYGYF